MVKHSMLFVGLRFTLIVAVTCLATEPHGVKLIRKYPASERMRLSRDGRLLLTEELRKGKCSQRPCTTGVLTIFDTRSGERLRELVAKPGMLFMAFDFDSSNTVVTLQGGMGEEPTILRWDPLGESVAATAALLPENFSSHCFLPGGGLLGVLHVKTSSSTRVVIAGNAGLVDIPRRPLFCPIPWIAMDGYPPVQYCSNRQSQTELFIGSPQSSRPRSSVRA